MSHDPPWTGIDWTFRLDGHLLEECWTGSVSCAKIAPNRNVSPMDQSGFGYVDLGNQTVQCADCLANQGIFWRVPPQMRA